MAECPEHTKTRELIIKVDESSKSAHHRLDEHKDMLDKHSSQIDSLVKSDSTNTANINNLICKIDGLINTIKWMIGLLVPTLLTIIGLLITVFVKR